MKTMLGFVLPFFFFQNVYGSGFEKSIPWGAKTAGVAGIASPYIQGSEAIFFNPAGLANDKPGQDISLNLSPTILEIKAPVTNSSVQEKNKSEVLIPGGLTYGRTLNDQWGIGVGLYIAGGSKAEFYPEVAGFASGLKVKTDLLITELALGAGYKVNDNLKLGAAWRIGMASGSLSTIAAGGPPLNNVEIWNAKDTQLNGFKLGAQYKLNEKTNLGATYRSEMVYHAKGTMGITSFAAGGATTTLPTSDATVGAVFPAAVNLGASHALTDTWKLFGEYIFTEYSKVKNLSISTPTASSPQELQWKDQHSLRVAAEYTGYLLPIRFGYFWTSQVTNNDYALPTIAPPSDGHTFTLGTGHAFGDVRVDAALEYFRMSGTASNKAVSNDLTTYALHLGSTYSF